MYSIVKYVISPTISKNMSYKDLNLDIDKIDDCINVYVKKYGWTIEKHTQHEKVRYTITIPGKEKALIEFFFKKNGKVTIGVTLGRNKKVTEDIAAHIKRECEIIGVEYGALSIQNFPQEDIGIVLDYLSSFIVEEKEISSGKQYKISSEHGEKININYYTNGRFLLQGKGVRIRQYVIEALCELLSYEDIIDIQSRSIEVDIQSDEILTEFQNLMPEAYGLLDSKLIAIISPSIVFRKLDISLADYSYVMYPVLRGVEGVVKSLLTDFDITLSREFKDIFIKQENGLFKLHDSKRIIINITPISDKIEECYNFFVTQRHSLFHVDDTITTTRTISNRQTAIDLCNEAFELIESTYKTVSENKV